MSMISYDCNFLGSIKMVRLQYQSTLLMFVTNICSIGDGPNGVSKMGEQRCEYQV